MPRSKCGCASGVRTSLPGPATNINQTKVFPLKGYHHIQHHQKYSGTTGRSPGVHIKRKCFSQTVTETEQYFHFLKVNKEYLCFPLLPLALSYARQMAKNWCSRYVKFGYKTDEIRQSKNFLKRAMAGWPPFNI